MIVIASLNAGNYDSPPLAKTFRDRNGKTIGSLDPSYRGYREWVPLEKIPSSIIEKTIQAEDRFFYWHLGINPISILKAAKNNLTQRKMIRGGSTITQQLAKNLIQEKEERLLPRTFLNKIRESFLAVGLEIKHSKTWILERYLNTIYYGQNSYGISAAAQTCFGKTLGELTEDEISTLVSFPKSPVKLAQLAQSTERFKKREHLGRHFIEYVGKKIAGTTQKNEPQIITTLDLELQKKIEEGIEAFLSPRVEKDPKITAAAVLIDIKTGDILAMTGSRDYFDETIHGNINAAVALRQPGSTLKPFTYFAAFSKGKNPNTWVTDEPLSFQSSEEDENTISYAPQNFDRRFHGTMTIREALANSYNVPAVETLNQIGISYYLDILKKFGFTSFHQPSEYYGLSITLGSGEVSLLELTNAYAALARGGEYLDYQFIKNPEDHPLPPPLNRWRTGSRERKSIIPNASLYASQITEILSDSQARMKAFGFNENLNLEGQQVAVKTGTSYNHRDNWTVGYTSSVAVGVWVGHADGSPMDPFQATTGASNAAPLWHLAMEAAIKGNPERVVFNPTLKEKPLLTKPSPTSEPNFMLLSPVPNATYRTSKMIPQKHQLILAHAKNKNFESVRLKWFLDGLLLKTTTEPEPRLWMTPTPGKHRLRIEAENKKMMPNSENVQEITFKVL